MIAPAAPERLAAPPSPPDDPLSWRLDARAGWRAAALDHLEQAPGTLCLTLARLPEVLRALDEPSGSLGGLVAPATVAIAGDGSPYLLDRGGFRLLRWDPCACEFQPVPCFGGRGGGAREMTDPRAIEISGRDLYLCDAGDPQAGGRVTVWALPGMALRSVWTLPADPPQRANPWTPVALAADGQGRFWVADPANAMVHRLDRLGRLRQSIGGMGGVRHLAVDCRGRVYAVLDGEAGARVLDPGGGALPSVDDPEPLRRCFPRLPFAVDAAGRLELSALCAGATGELWFDAAGQPVPPPPPPAAVYAAQGSYLSEPLDSRIYRCPWHRVVIRAAVPEGATLRMATYTAEAVPPPGYVEALPDSSWATAYAVRPGKGGEWDALVRSGAGRYLWLRLQLAGNGNATPRLESAVVEYPRVSLRRYLPAVWSEEPVAADFTDRFLAVFDAGFRGLERALDRQAALYDPLSAPSGSGSADFLSWLGEWIGVSLGRQWPEAVRRGYLKQAARLFPLRGTREGLRRLLLFFLGMEGDDAPPPAATPRCEPRPGPCGKPEPVPCAWRPPPLILEHFQLRRWLFLGCGRLGDDAVLWGQKIVNRSRLSTGGAADRGAQVGGTRLVTTPDPLRDPFHVYAHRFSVFVPAARVCGPDQRRALERLIAAETPAHALGTVEYVEPRFRIGVQSSIGLDAVVGRYPRGVELGGTRLGPASVLEGGPAAGGARIGASARLEQR